MRDVSPELRVFAILAEGEMASKSGRSKPAKSLCTQSKTQLSQTKTSTEAKNVTNEFTL
jgi:hypothetical protein